MHFFFQARSCLLRKTRNIGLSITVQTTTNARPLEACKLENTGNFFITTGVEEVAWTLPVQSTAGFQLINRLSILPHFSLLFIKGETLLFKSHFFLSYRVTYLINAKILRFIYMSGL